jgi:hypothetical protein
MRYVLRAALVLLLSVTGGGHVSAAGNTPAELSEQIEAIKRQQTADIAELRRRTDERIAALEAQIVQLRNAQLPPAPARAAGDAPAAVPAAPDSKFHWSSDFRLRYEHNTETDAAPARNRGVLRARVAGSYDVNPWLTVGARLATGDPDDPNSTDVTLSDFADDLNVNLDLAYARARLGALELYGGKIPNPFLRTDLVWDSDVNPDGLSAAWAKTVGGAKARLTALYFIVNEQQAGDDASMTGLQAGIGAPAWNDLTFDLAAGYYDYRLEGLVGADAGDTRSNLLAPGGNAYLSDFDLFDIIASVTFAPADTAWPAKIALDLVRNRGAATAADSGYALDFTLGRAAKAHDLRFGYGYARAETDAVFASFSHDNTGLATNYRQHTLAVDYLLSQRVVLNGTFYHYRADDPGANPVEWLNRLRLNFLVQF